ncbi:MAG: hypothetical protein LC640_12215 [Frankia sp.]|nr:hypothetical protein [Frankia sp.]
MPKLSKESARQHRGEAEVFQEWADEIDGYAASFVLLTEPSDLTPLLKGLPGDLCQCPHWGYVFKGTMTFRYADGSEETFAAGDAYYTPPGHAPRTTAGTEFVIFSPADQMAETEAAIERNMAALQPG